jgi:hypothetical protein
MKTYLGMVYILWSITSNQVWNIPPRNKCYYFFYFTGKNVEKVKFLTQIIVFYVQNRIGFQEKRHFLPKIRQKWRK